MKKFAVVLAATFALFAVACSKTPAEGHDSSVDPLAADILSRMTLEEKIGQVIQADISAVTPQQAKDYNLGSVLNGGNSAPGGGKTAAPEAWIALADAFWTASTDTSDGGVGIPLLWGTDAVHGHNNLQNGTIFPHNSGLGAANDPALIKEIGRVTAREVRATGIDWTFAPTLAVARDDRWGRAYESYSERPEIVAAYSKAMVEGLQGEQNTEGFLRGERVLATAKHFIGDGGTQLGIDKGDTIGDVDELLKLHGAGYQPAFDAGVQTVMASFSSINGEKMHGSKYLLTDVLRGKMGFDGFVVGDWNGHAEVPGCTATDCPESLEAGVDMYMAPDSWEGLYASLLEQAKSGELSMTALDQAVTRILEVKIRAGLFEAGLPSRRKSANTDVLGAPENSEIARRAVQQSLVLLKNENSVLPLSPSQTILVAGSGADSMQQQTGGWTLNWQGDGNDNSIFETGETIFAGIKTAVEDQGGKAVLSVNGTYTGKPDAAIVVFGEQPYAEYRGDRSDLVFEFDTGENLALLKELTSQGIPVVSVFLTGRPLWVNPHLNVSDAFVVGWLPGTEGGGIADVLIADKSGKARYDFTGRLSFTWPADGKGKPINAADDEGVLFPYGYGLSYASNDVFKLLPEESGVASGGTFNGAVVGRGDAAKPFSFFLGDSSNLNTPATALVSESLGGAIKTRGVDYKAQEDAREITWSGTGKASASIKTHRPVDMSKMGNPDNLVLSVEWRVEERPSGSVQISMGCGDGCGSELDLTSVLANTPEGKWAKTDIPMACFVKEGLKPSEVVTPFSLTSSSKGRITLHAVKIEDAEQKSGACPQ